MKTKDFLSELIGGQQTKIKTVYKVGCERLICEVFFENRNLDKLFPEY